MTASVCKVCECDDLTHAENLGHQCLEGALSWRKAAIELGVRDTGLKNHMLKHVVAPAVAEATAEAQDHIDDLIAEARAELEQQFFIAPPDVKPLILVAIHNLEGLRYTKPSQQHLIAALKTVQEMTGMKNEQRMLLGFAKAMFGAKPTVVTIESKPQRVLEGGEKA